MHQVVTAQLAGPGPAPRAPRRGRRFLAGAPSRTSKRARAVPARGAPGHRILPEAASPWPQAAKLPPADPAEDGAAGLAGSSVRSRPCRPGTGRRGLGLRRAEHQGGRGRALGPWYHRQGDDRLVARGRAGLQVVPQPDRSRHRPYRRAGRLRRPVQRFGRVSPARPFRATARGPRHRQRLPRRPSRLRAAPRQPVTASPVTRSRATGSPGTGSRGRRSRG